MTKTRNSSLIIQVMRRDLGLCRCCGFKASQVHHVIPLYAGGEDKPENMIALCDMCHNYSPDDKKQFYEYMKKGGHKTITFLGIITHEAMIGESKSGGEFSFQFLFNIGRELFYCLKSIDRENMLETFNWKDRSDVPDVNFNEYVKVIN